MKYTNQQIEDIKRNIRYRIDDPMWANHCEILKVTLSVIYDVIDHLQQQNEERYSQLRNMDKLIVKIQEDNDRSPLTEQQIEDILDDLEVGTFENAIKIIRAYEKIQGIN